MIGHQNREDSLRQNLEDSGFTHDMIELYMKSHEKNEISEQIKFLSKHRCLLLDNVRENNKRIDCLDYLVNKIKKEQIL
jgi:hypothetical protein